MLLCDTHCDTLFVRAMHPGTPCDITLEKIRQGGMNLQTMAMFVGDSTDMPAIRETLGKMKAQVQGLLDEGFVQITDPAEADENTHAFILSIEGCDILTDGLDQIADWRKMGVRMAALTWNYENCIGSPAKLNKTAKLKPYGREAVREMVKLGIAPDVSHLNEGGFYDLLDMGVIPLASHSCAAALCPHTRNLTDDQLKALFEAGGYVGVNFYPMFLDPNGKADLNTVADHVLYMLDHGGEGKIGFGSDFDGIEVRPEGLTGPQDFPALLDVLRKRGVTESILSGIAGQNLLDYYKRAFG